MAKLTGRPPSDRTFQLPPPRATAAEKDRIQRAAKLLGQPVSTFLRTCALEKATLLGVVDAGEPDGRLTAG